MESGKAGGRAMRSMVSGRDGVAACWACAYAAGRRSRPVRRMSGDNGVARLRLQMNRGFNILMYSFAKVAELVDALDSKSSPAHTG